MDKKSERMIVLHGKLMNGQTINKRTEAIRYHVTEKSIQRDIEDLRAFFFKQSGGEEEPLEYDRKEKGYRLREKIRKRLLEENNK